MNKVFLSNDNILNLADTLLAGMGMVDTSEKLFPVPRGGVPVVYALKAINPNLQIVDSAAEADYVVDDLIDSGFTRLAYANKSFLSLYTKQGAFDLPPGVETISATTVAPDCWLVFPWESVERSEDDTIVGTITNRIKEAGAQFHANDNIARFIEPGELTTLQAELTSRAEHFLRGLVIDLDNDHNTQGTAERIAKMYITEVFKGRYSTPPKITSFPNAKTLDEMYVTGPITLRSACSHHFVPIVGRVWIGVVPGERVIGLSKFNRIVEWIASRPQIQEELVMQIADYIENEIQPKGLAVLIKATHMCMTWRGVRESMDSFMTTSVIRGVIKDDPAARAEFLALANK
jgi:GTP cyclohydrolase I